MALRRVVIEILHHGHRNPATALGNPMTRMHLPTDPLAEARVAKSLAVPLRSLVAEAVQTARGQGRSWLDVAQALEFDDHEWSPEYAAFSYVTLDPEPDYLEPSFDWHYHSCGSPITDWGPHYGQHPSDSEQGHSADCRRHGAAVRAYLDQPGNE